jgi:multidrug resistance efflux pump
MLKKLSRLQIVMIVVFLAAIVYFAFLVISNKTDAKLRASGTIEAVEVNVSSETSGKVNEVLVDEGQTVKTGDPLLHLDPALLAAQRNVSASSLDSAKAAALITQNALSVAQAQYQIALLAALSQDKKARLGDWRSPDQKQFDQPNWYFTRAEQAQAAQNQVSDAKKALQDANSKLTDVTQSLDKANFLAAEQRLLNARMAYLISNDVNTRAQNTTSANIPITPYNLVNCAKNQGYHFAVPQVMNLVEGCIADLHLTKSSQTLYDNAKSELDSAQQAYNDLLTTSAGNEVLQVRADVSVAQEKYYSAMDRLRTLQTGEQSPSVTAAQGVVDQAQAAYDQSQKAVAQVQANLDLLDVQMSKLTINAPMDGVILARNVDPGEFVQPGGDVMTMANLNELTITVYVPEDRYGEIHLGQSVSVTVDSFPNETFAASVLYISDKAEFTPRNVQTVQGRSTTVYAVKLKVSDPQGKLKLGMPADVVFIAK